MKKCKYCKKEMLPKPITGAENEIQDGLCPRCGRPQR